MPVDIVSCTVAANRAHIMIVSDRKSRDGIGLVIDNIGAGRKEEDRLFEFAVRRQYRINES